MGAVGEVSEPGSRRHSGWSAAQAVLAMPSLLDDLISSSCSPFCRSLFEGEAGQAEAAAPVAQPAPSAPVPGRRASVPGPRSPSVQVGWGGSRPLLGCGIRPGVGRLPPSWRLQLRGTACARAGGPDTPISAPPLASVLCARCWQMMWARPTSRPCFWTLPTSSPPARVGAAGASIPALPARSIAVCFPAFSAPPSVWTVCHVRPLLPTRRPPAERPLPDPSLLLSIEAWTVRRGQMVRVPNFYRQVRPGGALAAFFGDVWELRLTGHGACCCRHPGVAAPVHTRLPSSRSGAATDLWPSPVSSLNSCHPPRPHSAPQKSKGRKRPASAGSQLPPSLSSFSWPVEVWDLMEGCALAAFLFTISPASSCAQRCRCLPPGSPPYLRLADAVPPRP